MSFSSKISSTYDSISSLLLELFDSPYLNLGYWNKKTTTFYKAQTNLEEVFGKFSKLNSEAEVIDIGCGTGKEVFYFAHHFKCKRITGIDISKAQIKMAEKERKENPQYASQISFILGEGLDLLGGYKKACNRILALECLYHLEDKELFFKNAHNALKKNTYLCIAEPILNNDSAYNQDSISFIQNEIIRQNNLEKIYKNTLHEKMLLFLSKEKELMRTCKYYNLFYPQYLKLIAQSGFSIEATQNISKNISGFYPVIKNKIIKMLKKYHSHHAKTDILLTILTIFYIRYCGFQNKSVGYYLIRARKI